MASIDIEMLREVFGDRSATLTLAKVTKLEVVATRALARVQVLTLPEELEVIATVSFPSCSQGGGFFNLPAPGDLGLIAYTDAGEGGNQEAYWMGHLSSDEDLIPDQAASGHLMAMARPGSNAYLASDTAVLLGKGGATDPASPLVLGDILQTLLGTVVAQLQALCDKISSDPVAIDSLGGSCVTHPTLVADLTAIKTQLTTAKTQYLDTDSSNILSQTAFTER